MNKLDVQHPSLTYQPDLSAIQLAEEIIPMNTDLEPAGRLLVLIPAEADYALATKRIWRLAVTTGMHIQLIGLCKDWSQEPSVRRGLVTMSALIRDGRVCADVKVEIGTSWVNVVKHNVQPGDMIVCFAEQRAGLLQRPLSQILQSNMNLPVQNSRKNPACQNPHRLRHDRRSRCHPLLPRRNAACACPCQ
jgi:hypothetical protein